MLHAIYGQLNCANLETSTKWFTMLFGREPDARPMPGLAEWHHGEQAGFQLYESKKHAGHGTLTLIVRGLRGEHARLMKSNLKPGEVEAADATSIVRLNDPDGNLVVLAQPGRA